MHVHSRLKLHQLSLGLCIQQEGEAAEDHRPLFLVQPVDVVVQEICRLGDDGKVEVGVVYWLPFQLVALGEV